jgi:hypothetical protein
MISDQAGNYVRARALIDTLLLLLLRQLISSRISHNGRLLQVSTGTYIRKLF